MKTIMTKWAMLMALTTAVGCSETETEIGIDPVPGGNGQVALGINANLKVDAGMKSATKSVVSGSAITYTKEQFASEAPGIGVVVTNKEGNDWYAPDAANGGYTGHHVWYMGDEKGGNWISINTKGGTFDATSEVPYFLTEEVGQVYAYYPYDKNNTSGISSATDLKIPITILATGGIDATTNNAAKIWNTNSSSWASNTSNNSINLSDPTENDYLYFAAEGTGRYVNNGRAKGQAPFDPEGGAMNADENNPGYLINLDMKHAMAMVSFRVYDGGNLSSNNVNFTKFEIKNHAGGSSPFKTGTGKMALVDGAITENNVTNGTVARTISNYILMRQIEAGEQEGEHAFIQNKKIVNGQTVSKSVSAIVYPTSFSDNEIDVDITLKEGNNPEVIYTVTLPGYDWTAGSNIIYTFSAGRNKLTVMDVSVEEWAPDEQPDISL